jgi:hypothetical protein
MAHHPQRARPRRPSTRLLARLGLCLVAAALVSLPLALERGMERTQIRDSIGLVPARLALTGSSDSELRLGLLGTIRLPVSHGPIGMSVTADGPPTSPDGGHGLASYFSPQMLQVYGGLFHDPGKAIRGYVDQLEDELQRQVLLAELFYTLLGGGVLLVATYLVEPGLVARMGARPWRAACLGVSVGLLASAAVAYVGFRQWAAASSDVSSVAYPLPALNGTLGEGAVTDSPVLRLAIEDAAPRIESLVDRQELRTREYIAAAAAGLRAHQGEMAAPRAGELAVMMQSDMHCNTAMITLQRRVVELLDERFGEDTVSLLAISGDLTTNGTAAEGGCIADEAAVAGRAPVAAVTGNHDSETSVRQMKKAGMTVLTGSTETLAGTSVLGAGDPNRTELFGPTAPRGDQTEESVGAATYRKAVADHPDLVLLHEGYAVQSFLGSGVTDMRAFLDHRGSPTRWWADDVRDLPTSAVFYGHWHRDVPPRVVWNSDGSWTLVMELNTSGGAIASPTLNHFSTPWSQPQQLASFPVVFKDRDSRLVTGYQLYSFAPDGTVRISPRVDVGAPGGHAVAPGS